MIIIDAENKYIDGRNIKIYNITDYKPNDDITEENLEAVLEAQHTKWNNEKYFFDDKEAKIFFNFSRKFTADKGKKGEKLRLLISQYEICTDILCVKCRDTGLRRFREAHINIPRKNGKSFIIALIMDYLYFIKPEYGAEFILVSNNRQLATNLYNQLKHFIEESILKKMCKITESKKEIYRKSENSYMRVLSSDASGADSYADFVFCMDEIHECKNQGMYDKLKTGQGIFDEPLGITITTASSGDDPTNLEMELYELSKSIARGEFEDDSFYYAIYEADDDCDIMDKEQWYKANPALGRFRKVRDVEDLANRAQKSKIRERAFRRFFLNQHVSSEIEGAIDMVLWEQACKKIKYEDIRYLENCAGLDLSASKDITAYVQVFKDDERGKYIIYPHLFTPKDTLQEKTTRDKVPYDQWASLGYIKALEGSYINFDKLHGYIKNSDNVRLLAFDRWGSPATQSALQKDFNLLGFGQGYRSMSPAIAVFEELLISGDIEIAYNPCFTWMAKNVTAVIDDAGNVKYSKRKSKNKIDGIIAMIMALGASFMEDTEIDFNAINDDYLKQMDW